MSVDPFVLISEFINGVSTSSNSGSTMASAASASASAGTTTPSRKRMLKVILFSRDRAFQLHECMRSLMRCVIEPFRTQFNSDVCRIKVYVIYKASNDEFRRAYRILSNRFGVDHRPLSNLGIQVEYQFINEDDATRFSNASNEPNRFEQSLNFVLEIDPATSSAISDNSDFVLFGVDDAIFYRKVDLQAAMSALDKMPSIFSFHFKLSTRIKYCHSAGNAEMKLPKVFTPVGSGDVVFFRREEGSHDWNYPWDLSCGLYRSRDVLEMLRWIKKMKPDSGYRNPNYLEANGEFVAKSMPHIFSLSMPFSACYASATPSCSVLTVNRVQHTFNTPVYQNPDCTIDKLNDLFMDNNASLDVDHLLEQASSGAYRSVHIGDFKIRYDESHIVSVIIPVFNSERYLGDALRSVSQQNMQESIVLEVVVVIDPRTSDTSMNIAKQFEEENKSNKSISVEVIQLESDGNPGGKGISQALNIGWRRSRGKYIARMDADDICAQGRFRQQLEYLQNNDDVGVLGTSVRIIGEDDTLEDVFEGEGKGKVIDHQPDPLWDMMFRCAVAHPTVMMRRQVLEDAGGYNEDEHLVEDYDLWMRVLGLGRWQIANIAKPLLFLRRHAGNASRKHLLLRQKRTSAVAWQNLFRHFVPPPNDSELVVNKDVIYGMQRGSEHLMKPPSNLVAAFVVVESLAITIIKSYQLRMKQADPMLAHAIGLTVAHVRKDSQARLLEIVAQSALLSESQRSSITRRFTAFSEFLQSLD